MNHYIKERECSYCKKIFFGHGSVFSNHVKNCPERNQQDILKARENAKIGERLYFNKKLGPYKDFEVTCHHPNCQKSFTVNEREKQFPLKEKYFCSRSCANSRGPREIKTKEKIRISALKNLGIVSEEDISQYKEKQKLKLQKPKKKRIKRTIVISICQKCGEEITDFRVRKYHGNCWEEKCNESCFTNEVVKSSRGWYKGYWCDSSYELAFVIYNLDHGIKFERNKLGFSYFDNKQIERKYFPDFIMENGSYVEIKGLHNENDILKWKYFPHKLTILFEDDLKEIFKYVREIYSWEYTKLYEDSISSNRLNNCLECGNPTKTKFCSEKCSGKFRKGKTKELWNV